MTFLGGYPGAVFRAGYTSVLGASAPPCRVDRLFLTHDDAGGSNNWSEVATDIAAGRTPILSVKFSGLSWSQVAAGSADSIMDSRLASVLNLNISGLLFPPRIAWHHEFEGDGTPTDYHAMALHMTERYKAQIRAAGWDLCFITTTGIYQAGSGGWVPADLQTAITGIDIHRLYADIYERPGGDNCLPYACEGNTWRNPSTDTTSNLRKYLDYCVAHGYTAGCPEFASRQWVSDPTLLKPAAWMQAVADWSRHTEMEFAIYYDRSVGDASTNANDALTHGGVVSPAPSVNGLTAFSHIGSAAVSTAPVVTSFNPTSGEVTTPVVIRGSHFTGATLVTFGGAPAPFTVQTDAQITASVPANAVSGKIAVTGPGGIGGSSASFLVIQPGGTGFVPGVVSGPRRVILST